MGRRVSCFIAILMLSFVLATGLTIVGVNIAKENTVPLMSTDDFLQTDGRRIISKTSDNVNLIGVNAGNFLVHEGWMSPLVVDGRELRDQRELKDVLINRFGYDKAKELLNTYYSNWWTETDFINVKNLGFNVVRLPFSYNIEDESGNLTNFDVLDSFIENAGKHGIYVILDLHGAYGSQNGSHHSSGGAGENLFKNEENMNKTVGLWREVSKRYKDNPIVAGYDLLNEPMADTDENKTGETQWNFYKRLVTMIRLENRDNHIIIIEGTWGPRNLPNPKYYFNFSNIVYSYHSYDWDMVQGAKTQEEKYKVHKKYIDREILLIKMTGYNVPTYIGEFTAFDNKDAWLYQLNEYKRYNISSTMWSYKIKQKASTWGLYTAGENLVVTDIYNDSFETIIEKFSTYKTEESFVKNEFLHDVYETYFSGMSK